MSVSSLAYQPALDISIGSANFSSLTVQGLPVTAPVPSMTTYKLTADTANLTNVNMPGWVATYGYNTTVPTDGTIWTFPAGSGVYTVILSIRRKNNSTLLYFREGVTALSDTIQSDGTGDQFATVTAVIDASTVQRNVGLYVMGTNYSALALNTQVSIVRI